MTSMTTTAYLANFPHLLMGTGGGADKAAKRSKKRRATAPTASIPSNEHKIGASRHGAGRTTRAAKLHHC
jgi:hypothetical protein